MKKRNDKNKELKLQIMVITAGLLLSQVYKYFTPDESWWAFMIGILTAHIYMEIPKITKEEKGRNDQ